MLPNGRAIISDSYTSQNEFYDAFIAPQSCFLPSNVSAQTPLLDKWLWPPFSNALSGGPCPSA
jgi:hypothetical protein